MIMLRLKPCCKECEHKDICVIDEMNGFDFDSLGNCEPHYDQVIMCSHKPVCIFFNEDGTDWKDYWLSVRKGEKTMDRLVEFDKYCKMCAYSDTEETDDPCNECLDNPINEDSHKPVNYKEAELRL